MHEVEAKFKVPDAHWDAVRARVESRCMAVGDDEEEDVYFLHPTREFARHDEALRLRRSSAGMVLCYKGPRDGGQGAKARVEEEVRTLDDPTPLLAILGFRQGPGLRKRRRTLRLDDATVSLDEVPGLGRFVEVELLVGVDDVDGVDGARRRIEELGQDLGLDPEWLFARSYLEAALQAGVATRS